MNILCSHLPVDAGSGSPSSISTDSSEHEIDLYPASKSSKATLTLDIPKGRIYSSIVVDRGLPLPGFCIFLVLGSFVLSGV